MIFHAIGGVAISVKSDSAGKSWTGMAHARGEIWEMITRMDMMWTRPKTCGRREHGPARTLLIVAGK
jgi:hypothetical protein